MAKTMWKVTAVVTNPLGVSDTSRWVPTFQIEASTAEDAKHFAEQVLNPHGIMETRISVLRVED